MKGDNEYGSLNDEIVKPQISDGAVEALKWVGLVVMTGDHVDKYLWNGTQMWLFAAGRLALPIFVCVLGWNLARPGALERGAYGRTMWRLAVCGMLATPAFVGLGGLWRCWWPVNVMFTLLVLTGTLYLLERGRRVQAAAVFLLGGGVVEFWWPGLGLGVAAWWYGRGGEGKAVALGLGSLVALGWVNGNAWALAVVPVAAAVIWMGIRVPRWRWVFYAYYPLHLAAIWLIRIPMRKAGYLFFY